MSSFECVNKRAVEPGDIYASYLFRVTPKKKKMDGYDCMNRGEGNHKRVSLGPLSMNKQSNRSTN